MASDWVGGRPYEGMKGFSVALNYEAVDEARRVFDALADGSMVIVPLQATFFAEAFGMVIDRFGTPWAIGGGPRRVRQIGMPITPITSHHESNGQKA
jgi:PhnB protein